MMTNKFLKMFLFCAIVCGNAFSLQYNIRVMNCSGEEVHLSKVAVREVSIVESPGKVYCFPKELRLKQGEAVTISVDARPYFQTEKQEDSITIQAGASGVTCFFKPVLGDTYVYPSLEPLTTGFKFGKDTHGSDYTLTIGKMLEIDPIGISALDLVQQGATLSPRNEHSSSSDFEGIF